MRTLLPKPSSTHPNLRNGGTKTPKQSAGKFAEANCGLPGSGDSCSSHVLRLSGWKALSTDSDSVARAMPNGVTVINDLVDAHQTASVEMEAVGMTDNRGAILPHVGFAITKVGFHSLG